MGKASPSPMQYAIPDAVETTAFWRSQCNGTATQTAEAVGWSRPEPVRCSVCVLYARAREVELLMSPEA